MCIIQWAAFPADLLADVGRLMRLQMQRVRALIQRRAMVRAMKACQRVLLAVTVKGR